MIVGDNMASLDSVKNILESNNDITREIKDDLFELIVIFNHEFPNVGLDNLESHLKTLKIKKSSKFFSGDISTYDYRHNILYFNQSCMSDDYDFRHILMFELLNIISCNKVQTGFNSDDKFEALNIGYTEILANYLVGNNGEKLIYPNEAIMANMIGVVVGNENLFESYFNNDPRILLNALAKAGVEL